MVRGLPGPVPSLPASTIRCWSSRRREILEIVCGDSPTSSASSTRLRPGRCTPDGVQDDGEVEVTHAGQVSAAPG